MVIYKSGPPGPIPPAAQVAALLRRFEPARERLRTLMRTVPVEAGMTITGEAADSALDWTLDPEHLAFLADLSLQLTFHAAYHEGSEYYRELGRCYRETRLRSPKARAEPDC